MEHVNLLEIIDIIQSGQFVIDPSDFALQLQSYREKLILLLHVKGQSAESRRQVENLLVQSVLYGEQRLDPEPDRRLALLLSDELKIDEVLAVEFLITAAEQRGTFTAESAAGIFFEERQTSLKCLLRLLVDVVSGMTHEEDIETSQVMGPYASVVRAFVEDMLHLQSGESASTTPPAGSLISSSANSSIGQKGLVVRIIELLQDNSMEPSVSSRLPFVKDEAGIPASRSVMLQLERRLLSKCLFYALIINQRVAPDVVIDLLDLLHNVGLKAHRTGSKDAFLAEERQLLLLCCVLTLTPQEGRGNQERSQLKALVDSAPLREKIMAVAGQDATSVGGGTLRISWGLLQVLLHQQQGLPGPPSEDARKHILEGAAAGAFSFLRQVFDMPFFKLDDSLHQGAVSCVVYRLVAQALLADQAMSGSFARSLTERSMSLRCKASPSYPNSSIVQQLPSTPGAFQSHAFYPSTPPAHQGSAKTHVPTGGDHLGTVIGLLAATFAVHPQLWLSSEQPVAMELKPLVERFITFTASSEAMKAVPEVRVPFLRFLTSMATGEYGASMVVRQMAEMARLPGYEMLTWRKLFLAMIEYCIRYNKVLAEVQRSGGSTSLSVIPTREERLMNEHEADIMSTFLALFRQVVEQGPSSIVRSFLEGLERELGPSLSGLPLYEPLFQLMCHPVPNTVKASLDGALSALATIKDLAPRLLERLMQCAAVVQHTPIMPGVPRLDLITQINEVEARKEEYPETISFIKLLNSLVAAAAASSSATEVSDIGLSNVGPAASGISLGGVGGQDLAHFTAFVVQHVLAHLWQRAYKQPAQKWEIAAVCFQHLELVLDLAARSGIQPAPSAGTNRQPPGYMVLHDMLGGGVIMQSLMHILQPGYQDLATVQPLPMVMVLGGSGSAEGSAGLMPLLLQGPGGSDATGNGGGYMAGGLGGASGTAGSTQVLGEAIQPVKEQAVISGLRVLTAALRMDLAFLSTLNRLYSHDRYQPLHQQLKSPKRLNPLMEYICYQDSVEVQIEAIRIGTELVQRLPNVVELMQQPGGNLSSCHAVRQGYALALRQSLMSHHAIDNLEEGPSGPDSPAALFLSTPDPRAALILRLALRCGPGGGSDVKPSFTHLLMGYDVEPSMGGIEESLLLPLQEYSLLTVIEKALTYQGGLLCQTKPKLYSQCLCLLYRLAAFLPSSGPMLVHLHPKANSLVPLGLRCVLASGLPSLEKAHNLAAALHQRSWLLRLEALMLLRMSSEDASCKTILAQLLSPDPPVSSDVAENVDDGMRLEESGRANGCMSLGLYTLQLLADLDELVEPQLADICKNAEERRMLREMTIGDISAEALLSPAGMAAVSGTNNMVSETGDVLLDVGALYPQLMARYEQYTARCGVAQASSDLPASAIKSALRFAQQYNTYILLRGSLAAAAEAWGQAVEVVFTRHFDQVASVLPTFHGGMRAGPAEALLEVLSAVLGTVKRMLGKGEGGSAVTRQMAEVARMLLSKLQEQVVVNASLGQSTDPLSLIRAPSRCHELLRTLLDVLQLSRRAQGVRVQLYGCLLQYMQYCRGSKLASCSPTVLESLLEGISGATPALNGEPSNAAAIRLDANQDAIDRGNAALLIDQAATLTALLSRDALDQSAPQLYQTLALHVLAALVGNGGGYEKQASAMVQALYSCNVPQTLLQLLNTLPQQVLVQQPKRSRRSVYVIEAQLSLLLRLVESGPLRHRQLSAQRLFSLHTLQYVTGCGAIDVEPEDPGVLRSGTTAQLDSLRYRLHHVLAPCLRLVLAIAATLPDSAPVKTEVRLFTEGHYRTLDRVLRDAAGSGGRDWYPAERELEQAELVSALLTRLVPVWGDLHPTHGEGLRYSMYRLAATFCCLDIKSGSPFVRALAGDAALMGQPGVNRSSVMTRSIRLSTLRSTLSRFLCDMVARSTSADGLFRCCTSTSSTLGTYGIGGGSNNSHARSELDPATARPSLLLFRELLEQSALDISAALEELEELLSILQNKGAELDDATCQVKLKLYGPQGGLAAAAVADASSVPPAPHDNAAGITSSSNGDSWMAGAMGLPVRRRLTQHYLSLAASGLDQQVGRLLFTVENALAVIVIHFLRYLPRPFGAGNSSAGAIMSGSQLTANEDNVAANNQLLEEASVCLDLHNLKPPTEEDAANLGTSADLAYFMSKLQETLCRMEELLERRLEQAMRQRNLEGIDIMTRTLKVYCSMY
ncbi:hypothetical protein CEUSTIGMA_g3784.t1 [Chlamydomonas eustigma]|uniref:Nuclear pore complex protein Nup205 n=1 Tax=Chlamydomonas eustigma TaxID=1157962 RepID=A0A250WZS5_9CHLO|nr:hypothetical protein CEUSTIGMA_g3784.t1 [Chlamydomonas eustigma]|eukprot:GAX76338.1 hypothetical protein CEUSTIGMA_g3784.t1 [Chlamydomonas eustigma]